SETDGILSVGNGNRAIANPFIRVVDDTLKCNKLKVGGVEFALDGSIESGGVLTLEKDKLARFKNDGAVSFDFDGHLKCNKLIVDKLEGVVISNLPVSLPEDPVLDALLVYEDGATSWEPNTVRVKHSNVAPGTAHFYDGTDLRPTPLTFDGRGRENGPGVLLHGETGTVLVRTAGDDAILTSDGGWKTEPTLLKLGPGSAGDVVTLDDSIPIFKRPDWMSTKDPGKKVSGSHFVVFGTDNLEPSYIVDDGGADSRYLGVSRNSSIDIVSDIGFLAPSMTRRYSLLNGKLEAKMSVPIPDQSEEDQHLARFDDGKLVAEWVPTNFIVPPPSGIVDASNASIVNVAEPVDPMDAVTLNYAKQHCCWDGDAGNARVCNVGNPASETDGVPFRYAKELYSRGLNILSTDNFGAGGDKITNIADPVNLADAANVAYLSS
ncbi:MAG TPA: hypothetical protein VFT30_01625, partial [Nitrospira sp.]|nr:hypothetical protein [Nitrospira sp.]